MATTVSGQMVESCSCTMLCPCWFAVPELMKMDRGWCDTAILFRIERGTSDGVDLTGRNVALALDFPGPTLFDGKATARIYLDAGASPAQRKELEALFQGKRGGGMAVVGGLVTKWLPTESTRITLEEKDGEVNATVGAFGRIHSKRLKNQAGRVVTLHNSGFGDVLGLETGELAPSGSEWKDPLMPRTFTTDSGVVGKFAWKP